EERLPAVLGQRRVGRRRGDLRQARLVEDVARGLRLTGERQADDTHDLLGVDHLGDDAGRLLRNTLGLELLELDLTVLVGVVVLLHRQLDAVQDVLTQRGVLTVDGARVSDGDVAALGVTVSFRLVSVRRLGGRVGLWLVPRASTLVGSRLTSSESQKE